MSPAPNKGNSTLFNLFTALTAAGEAGKAPCESIGTAQRGVGRDDLKLGPIDRSGSVARPIGFSANAVDDVVSITRFGRYRSAAIDPAGARSRLWRRERVAVIRWMGAKSKKPPSRRCGANVERILGSRPRQRPRSNTFVRPRARFSAQAIRPWSQSVFTFRPSNSESQRSKFFVEMIDLTSG